MASYTYTKKLLIGVITGSLEEVKKALLHHNVKWATPLRITFRKGVMKAYLISRTAPSPDAPEIEKKIFHKRRISEVHQSGIYTPLTYAIAVNHLAMISLLLTKVDVNYISGNTSSLYRNKNDFHSPLYEALNTPSLTRVEICRLLVNAKVEFQSLHEHDRAIDFLKVILDKKILSPQKFIALCKAFIQAGFHFASAMNILLFTAIKHGQVEVVDFLLKQQKYDDWDSGHQYIKGYGNCTPLLAAIYYEDVSIVKKLLRAGENADKKNSKPDKSKNVFTPLLLAIKLNNVPIIRLLLEHNVDVDLQTINGMSPLISTIFKNQPKTVSMLLSAHADPNQRGGKYNRLPLEVAIHNHNQAICDILIDQGKNIALNLLASTGNTLLIEALEYGMDDVAVKLIDHCINIKAMSIHCETALQIAAHHNLVKSVELLLQKLPQRYLNYVNAQGDTALSIASKAGYTDIVTLLQRNASNLSYHQISEAELKTNNNDTSPTNDGTLKDNTSVSTTVMEIREEKNELTKEKLNRSSTASSYSPLMYHLPIFDAEDDIIIEDDTFECKHRNAR